MAQQQQQQGRGVNAPAANVHQPLVAGGAAAVGGPGAVMAAAGGAVAGAGGAPVAPAFGRPAVMPEAYDGSGDWVEYIQYFDQCAQVNGWNDPQKAQYLAVRLRGGAQRFLATIPAARRAVWQHVSADLERRFAPPANERQFKAQFRTRRRKSGEDLAHLADDLRRLVVRAYPNMPGGLQDELVRDQFIEAVSPVALRVRLQENPPATVQAALEMALHLEKVWRSVDLPSEAPQRLVGPYGESQQTQLVTAAVDVAEAPARGQTDVLERTLSSLVRTLDQLLERRDAPSGQGGRGRGRTRDQEPARRVKMFTCWNCGEPGHRAAQCPREAQTGRGGYDGSRRGPLGNGQ
eukprot:scpid20143/ scgid15938/ 